MEIKTHPGTEHMLAKRTLLGFVLLSRLGSHDRYLAFIVASPMYKLPETSEM